MGDLLLVIIGLVGLIVGALGGGPIWRRIGERRERDRRSAQDARAGLAAERNRKDIEDAIAQDPDLAERARRNGLVRPER